MAPPPSPQTTVANNPPLTKQAKLKQQLWGSSQAVMSHQVLGHHQNQRWTSDTVRRTVIDKTGKTRAVEGGEGGRGYLAKQFLIHLYIT